MSCPDLVLHRDLELELSGHGAAVLGLGRRLQFPQLTINSLDEIVQVLQLSVVLEDVTEALDEEAAVLSVSVGEKAGRGGAVAEHVTAAHGLSHRSGLLVYLL